MVNTPFCERLQPLGGVGSPQRRGEKGESCSHIPLHTPELGDPTAPSYLHLRAQGWQQPRPPGKGCDLPNAPCHLPGAPSPSLFAPLLCCLNSSNFTNSLALYHKTHGKGQSQKVGKGNFMDPIVAPQLTLVKLCLLCLWL